MFAKRVVLSVLTTLCVFINNSFFTSLSQTTHLDHPFERILPVGEGYHSWCANLQLPVHEEVTVKCSKHAEADSGEDQKGVEETH